MTEDEKLSSTVFFVEATNTEQFYLWQENKLSEKPLIWEQDTAGFLQCVGTVKIKKEEFPVYVSFTFAKLNGKQICFYYPTSRIVDHKMIEKFLKQFPVKYDKGTRRAQTNAMNFHHCIHFCRE